MTKIDIQSLDENFINDIGREFMLVCAGTKDAFNMMTASWGGMGYMWNKPCAFTVIRPERFTYEFVERNRLFTISFLGDNKQAYKICGSQSGRNVDKAKAAGLTPLETQEGAIAFQEARLTLVCRKMYADALKPDSFIDKAALDSWYGGAHGGLHKLYISEIAAAYTK